MDIVTRKEALAKGLKHYFTGEPCARGHIDRRFTSIGKCMACAREDIMRRHVHTTDKRRQVTDTASLIAKAKTVHGDKYTYENAQFGGAKTKTWVTCPVHGDFSTSPSNLLSGKGCPRCANEATGKRCTATTEEFIAKATDLFGGKYDYSQVVYKAAHTKVIIGCREHGTFEQTPTNHLTNKEGCPKCNHMRSAGEAEPKISL